MEKLSRVLLQEVVKPDCDQNGDDDLDNDETDGDSLPESRDVLVVVGEEADLRGAVLANRGCLDLSVGDHEVRVQY